MILLESLYKEPIDRARQTINFVYDLIDQVNRNMRNGNRSISQDVRLSYAPDFIGQKSCITLYQKHKDHVVEILSLIRSGESILTWVPITDCPETLRNIFESSENQWLYYRVHRGEPFPSPGRRKNENKR